MLSPFRLGHKTSGSYDVSKPVCHKSKRKNHQTKNKTNRTDQSHKLHLNQRHTQQLDCNNNEQDGVTLCTLGIGTTFGASVMPGKSHSVSVMTNEECTLLRVRRADFQEIFKTRDCNNNNNLQQRGEAVDQQLDGEACPLFYPFAPQARPQERSAESDPNGRQLAAPARFTPSPSSSGRRLEEQQQEHQHQQQQQPFVTCCYKFWLDRSDSDAGTGPSATDHNYQEPQAAGELDDPAADKAGGESDVLLETDSLLLGKLAPDACFRLILSKQPYERSQEEVDMVFEELQHLKALSHLTNSVKKQLAACVQGEHHARQNTIIFNQGDVGHSWYIILRGSVNVVIVGKGVVCTLHDGDDFGKLALVNDAPRAATIVTNEPQCYFLRVDKHDFNTILRDVEANTVRLKEHGK